MPLHFRSYSINSLEMRISVCEIIKFQSDLRHTIFRQFETPYR